MADFYGQYPPTGGSGGGGGSGTGFTATGTAVLSGGTATVLTASVGVGSKVWHSHEAPSGIQGILSIASIVPGVSFVINSTSGSDSSTVVWGII